MKNFGWFFLIPCLLIAFLSCGDKAKEAESYVVRARIVGDLIMAQTSAYISQSKAYISAWEYAKVTGEDFETSVRHVLGVQAEHNKIEFLSMKEKIAERFEKLGQPPQNYAEAQETLSILYDLYLKLHPLVLNPSPPQDKYEKSIDELTTKIEKAGKEFYALLGI